MDKSRLPAAFFMRKVTLVAPDLLGKTIVKKGANGKECRFIITETEAYCGSDDKACHASKGKTVRTEVMFRKGGLVYVYLIYGMYWMLNFVTGEKNDASAVLIRGVKDVSGPGRVGRELKIDKSLYGEDLSVSDKIWVEDSGFTPQYTTHPRIGINYAGEPWVSKPWRFVMDDQKTVSVCKA